MSQNRSLKLIIYEKSDTTKRNGPQDVHNYLEVLQRVLPVSSGPKDLSTNTVDIFTDKNSSFNGLLGVLQQIKYNHIDYVVIPDLDDLPDDPTLFDTFMQTIEKYGSILLVLKEGLLSNILNHKISMYEYHLEKYQSLIFQKSQERKLQPNSQGTIVPFGYFWTILNHSTIILPYTPYYATKYQIPPICFRKNSANIYPGEIVTSIFDWYLVYQSLTYIVTRLQELKIPTPGTTYQALRLFLKESEKNAHPQLPASVNVAKIGIWKATTVKRILENSFYTNDINENTNGSLQSMDVTTEMNIPLISKKTFTAVKELLNKIV